MVGIAGYHFQKSNLGDSSLEEYCGARKRELMISVRREEKGALAL